MKLINYRTAGILLGLSLVFGSTALAQDPAEATTQQRSKNQTREQLRDPSLNTGEQQKQSKQQKQYQYGKSQGQGQGQKKGQGKGGGRR